MANTPLATTPSSPPNSFSWPNQETLTNMSPLLLNFAMRVGQASYPLIQATSFPLRAFNVHRALLENRPCKALAQAGSWAVLFLPYGVELSLLTDCAAELFNWYQSTSHPSLFRELLDPHNQENAYTILGVPQDKREDLSWIANQHRTLISTLENKQRKSTPVFAAHFQKLIDQVNAAYTHLCSEK